MVLITPLSCDAVTRLLQAAGLTAGARVTLCLACHAGLAIDAIRAMMFSALNLDAKEDQP